MNEPSLSVSWVDACLERRCGLPAASLAGLDDPALSLATEHLRAAVDEERRARVAACEVAAALIAQAEGRPDEPLLVQLRRDLWNARPLRPKRLVPLAPAVRVALEAAEAAVRGPAVDRDAAERALDVALRGSLARARTRLRRELLPLLEAPLSMGSPSLWSAVRERAHAEPSERKGDRRADLTLLAYAQRAAANPSPLGAFASVCTSPPHDDADESQLLDAFLARLLDALRPQLWAHRDALVIINGSLSWTAESARFVSPVVRGEALREIAARGPVGALRSLPPDRCLRVSELLGLLDGDDVRAAAAAEGLARAGLLTLAPPRPLDTARGAADLADWLGEHPSASVRAVGVDLARIARVVEAFPRLAPARRQRFLASLPRLIAQRFSMRADIAPDRLVYTTTRHAGAPARDLTDIRGQLSALSHFMGRLDVRAPEAGVLRHVGPTEAPTLLELYERERKQPNPAATLAHFAGRILPTADDEIALERVVAPSARSPRTSDARARSWAAYVQEAGCGRWVLAGLGPGYGSRWGRFLSDEAAATAALRARATQRSAAIHAAVREPCSFNANRSPGFCQWEIILPGGRPRLPAGQQIAVAELRVRRTAGAALFHPSLGDVRPVFEGLERVSPSPLARLLRSLGPLDEEHPLSPVLRAVNATHDREEAETVFPRIVFRGSLVVARRTLRLTTPRALLRPDRDDRRDLLALQGLRARHRLPERVFVRFDDAPDPADRRPELCSFASALSLQRLAARVRHSVGTLWLAEALPDPLTTGGDGHVREWLLEWDEAVG